MRKSLFALLVLAGMSPEIWAQTTIIDTDFTTNDYSNGNIIGQNGWTISPNTGGNAFNIIGASSNGWADTASAVGNFDTNGGNYAYLSGVSVSSGADTEWDGSMDFSLSMSSNLWGKGDVFRIGISSDVAGTTGLVNAVSSDVYLRVRVNNGTVNIKTHGEEGDIDLLSIDAFQAGWNAESNDLQTDPMRLLWNVRQTRDAGDYRVSCSLANLNPSSSNAFNVVSSTKYISRPDAWSAGSANFVMGHAAGAFYAKTNDTYEMNDILIDHLSFVETSDVDPVLGAPVAQVAEGNALVDLEWNYIPEASSYSVARSDSGMGGPFIVQVSGLTTNGWQDTGLTNGDEYYYIVTARGVDATPGDSDPVLAVPDVASSGNFLNTTFSSNEVPAYVDGDLAGQNRWKAITNGNLNAFTVDSTGDGIAETETSQNWSRSQVYYSKFTSNEVGSVWSGTTVFSLKATPEAGNWKTNIYDEVVGGITNSVTNAHEICNLSGSAVYEFGLTSEPGTALDPKKEDDVLISVRYGGQGTVSFNLNGYKGEVNNMLELERYQIGWDPQWQDQPESNGPIFETEMISLDWNIRKATATNTYTAEIVVNIGTNSYPGRIEYTDESDPSNRPEEAYPAEFVWFAMGHNAKDDSERIDLYIDSVSVTHTNDSDIPLAIPKLLAGVPGNLEIDLGWAGSGEQSAFNIYRSEVQGGPYTKIDDTTALVYTDLGLEDLRTYFYVVTAVYGATESAASDEFAIRALAINNPLSFGSGVTDAPSSQVGYSDFSWTETISGGLINRIGAETGNSIVGSAATTAGYPVTTPALHAIIQQPSNEGIQFNFRTGNDLQIKRNNQGGAMLLWVEGSTESLAEASFECNTHSWSGDVRAAIRGTDGTWYVSEALVNSSVLLITDFASEQWGELTLATSSSTQYMSVGTYSLMPGLDEIDACGVFSLTANGARKSLNFWKLSVGSQPSGYDHWTDSQDLYNEDAAKTNDYDGDGLNNVWEWGMGGDPKNAGDVGIKNRYTGMDTSGTNLIYVYPRLKSEPRPDYFLTETDNLVYTDFSEEYDYEVGTGDWPGKDAFEAVTNVIPTSDTVKFIQLNVE